MAINQTIFVTNSTSEPFGLDQDRTCFVLPIQAFEVTFMMRIIAYVVSGISALSSVVATIPNGLIIYTVFTRTHLRRKPYNILLSSLALTDFLVGVLLLPVSIARRLLPIRDGIDICWYTMIHAVLTTMLTTCSLLMLPVISIERYLAVFHVVLHRTKVTRKWIVILLASIWLFCIIYAGLLFNPNIHLIYGIAGVIIVTSTAITAWSYSKIVKRILHQRLQVVNTTSDTSGSTVRLNQAKELNVAKHLGLVITCMLLCYLPPIVVAHVMVSVAGLTPKFGFVISPINELVVLLNSCINPILYCSKSKEMRIAIMTVVGLRVRRPDI